MSDSLNITSAEAKAIVLKAATENGWISQEDRDNSPPRTLEALKNVRERLGDALEMYATFKHDFRVLHLLKLVD
jgi:hypothetical protein